MKKLIFTICLCAIAYFGHSQSSKYLPAMEANLKIMDTAKAASTYLDLSGKFERIANAEKTQWLPFYYAALSLDLYGFQAPESKKDEIGDKALALIDQAQKLNDNSELYAPKYMAYIIQMLVDPMNRYQSYGMLANDALSQGMKLDSLNPRLFYLKGSGLLQTPTFAGGGKDAAKPYLEKSIELFDKEKPAKMYPNWGKTQALETLEKCK
ncbi:hypothetical protein [Rhizosphaericola mali]|uniref:Tetratricopeptide repeat protein n=1 Tax=Rhizosphaericola mali TaxID=2545455 RepID=A0A5P2FX80_9BACT|nr:hypothetical protein [Rhizosphaericola mali]QES87795.1 hypothetical protein E0W69_003635 [Rhizosphaericola mali]